jgi:hypothetical protein
MEYDHGYSKPRKVLLEGEIPVNCHEGIKLFLSQRQQITVLDSPTIPLAGRSQQRGLQKFGQYAKW